LVDVFLPLSVPQKCHCFIKCIEMTVGEYNTFQFQPIVGFVKTVKTVFFQILQIHALKRTTKRQAIANQKGLSHFPHGFLTKSFTHSKIIHIEMAIVSLRYCFFFNFSLI
jgi:hypothetical protein